MFLEDLTEWLIHSKRDLDNLRDLYDLVGRRERGAIRFYRDQLELLMLKRNDVICQDAQHLLALSSIDDDGEKTTSTSCW
jgi:hypothetical protein